MNKNVRSVSSAALIFFLTSCASPPRLITPETVQNSQVNISYNLGHSRYRFLAKADSKKAEISSWRDDKVLAKRAIPLSKYLEFADQVHRAVKSHSATPASGECRTPFRIQMVSKEDQYTVSGCRGESGDEKIGQLIKEGEFLLYTE